MQSVMVRFGEMKSIVFHSMGIFWVWIIHSIRTTYILKLLEFVIVLYIDSYCDLVRLMRKTVFLIYLWKERREGSFWKEKWRLVSVFWCDQNSFYSLSLVIKMTLFCVLTAFWICQKGWVLTDIWGYCFKASALFLLIQVS